MSTHRTAETRPGQGCSGAALQLHLLSISSARSCCKSIDWRGDSSLLVRGELKSKDELPTSWKESVLQEHLSVS
ncbi:hypothetical protein GN956_G24914 [Arapaima gigas]